MLLYNPASFWLSFPSDSDWRGLERSDVPRDRVSRRRSRRHVLLHLLHRPHTLWKLYPFWHHSIHTVRSSAHQLQKKFNCNVNADLINSKHFIDTCKWNVIAGMFYFGSCYSQLMLQVKSFKLVNIGWNGSDFSKKQRWWKMRIFCQLAVSSYSVSRHVLLWTWGEKLGPALSGKLTDLFSINFSDCY